MINSADVLSYVSAAFKPHAAIIKGVCHFTAVSALMYPYRLASVDTITVISISSDNYGRPA